MVVRSLIVVLGVLATTAWADPIELENVEIQAEHRPSVAFFPAYRGPVSELQDPIARQARIEALEGSEPRDAEGHLELAVLRFEEASDAYYDDENPPPHPDHGPTLEALDALLSAHPDFENLEEVYYLKGFVLTEMGDEPGALKAFEKLHKLAPRGKFAQEALFRIGEAAFARGELTLARDAFQEAVALSEGRFYEAALYHLAWTLYQQDAQNEAFEYFAELVEREGSDVRPEAMEMMSHLLIDAGSEPSESWSRLVSTLGSETPALLDVWAAYADGLLDRGRMEHAVEAYRGLLERKPCGARNVSVFSNLLEAQSRVAPLNIRDAFDEGHAMLGEASPWRLCMQELGDTDAIQAADDLLEKIENALPQTQP